MRKPAGGYHLAAPVQTSVSQQHLLAALDFFPTPAIITFGEGGRAYVNRPLAELINLRGTDRELNLDALPYRVVDEHGEVAPENLPVRRALRGETVQAPLIIKARGDNPIHVMTYARPIVGDDGRIIGGVATFFDVREQRRLEAEKRSTQARLDRSAERLLYLARAGEALSETLNVEAVLNTLEQLVIPRIATFAFVMLLDGHGGPSQTRIYHADSGQRIAIENIIAELKLSPGSFASANRILATGAGELIPSIESILESESLPDGYRVWVERFLNETKLRQAMGVPLRTHGQTIGVLFVGDPGSHTYTEEDLRFLEEVARRAASAIENAQSYERQQQALQTMQRALLPAKLPTVSEYGFDVVYTPGDDEALIGGDWYDAFEIPDGRIAISIGDVTGRGLIAAVLMGKVRHSLSAISYYETNPVRMLDIADATLRRRNDEVIVTAFVGLLDPKEQTFTYATAGHPAPFLKRADGSILMLPCHGLPLGVRSHDEASPATIKLSAGDLLLLYTDGLTESTQDLIEGERHVRETLERLPKRRESDAAHYVLEEVLPGGSRDDVAILSVEVCGARTSAQSELYLKFDASDLRMAHEARRVFISLLRELGDPNSDFDGAELVFGELVGNVVRHAPGDISVSVDWEDGFAALTVCDRGRGYEGIRALPHDPLSESGRGLFLVNALTRAFKVSPREDGGMEATAVLNVARRG